MPAVQPQPVLEPLTPAAIFLLAIIDRGGEVMAEAISIVDEVHRFRSLPAVTEKMLRDMFIGDPPGNTDRNLNFSTAVPGGLFFSPTVDFLDDPPPPPGSPAAAKSSAIGSLKGTPR